MRKVVFLGNCQGRRLQEFYDEHFSEITGDTTQFIVSYHFFHEEYRQALESADVIVAQLLDMEHSISLSMVKTAAKIIRYPSITGAFLWPFSGVEHIYNKPLSYCSAGPFGREFGDRWLNKKISEGVQPDEIVRRYLDLDVPKIAHLDRLYEITLLRARERDRKTDFQTASIIESSLTNEPLFLTPANLELTLFKELAWGVYERLGVPRRDIDRGLRKQWRTPFPLMHHPIHPSVVEHFGLKDTNDQSLCRTLAGERLTYEEWYQRYVRFEWNDPLARATLEPLEPQPERAYLERRISDLFAALANSKGSDAGYVLAGALLNTLGNRELALEQWIKVEKLDSESPSYPIEVAHWLAERGDFQSSEQKLVSVSQKWPAYSEPWARLASLYFRMGRWDDAAAAIQHALLLDPANLSHLEIYSDIVCGSALDQDLLQRYSAAICIRPYDFRLKAAFVRRLVDQRQWSMALDIANKALQLQPLNLDLLAQRDGIISHLDETASKEFALADARR